MSMMDRMENIDELFRNELKDYALIPPEEVWGSIEQDLSRGRKRILFPVWMRIAASIVVLASISWLVWKYSIVSEEVKILGNADQNSEQGQPASDQIATTGKQSDPSAVDRVIAENETSVFSEPQITEIAVEDVSIPVEPGYTQVVDESSPEDVLFADNFTSPKNTKTVLVTAGIEEESFQILWNQNQIADRNQQIVQQNLLALQEQNADNGKRRTEWSIGGHGGPQYSYRDVDVNTPVYPIDDYDKYESGILAYSGGLHIEIEPASRFTIQSGIYFSKIGQIKSSIQINEQYSDIGTAWPTDLNDVEPERLPTDVINSTGNITFDKNLTPPVSYIDQNIDWGEGVITAEQYFEYVEIPLLVRYLIVDRKIDVNLCTGLWADFLVGNKAMASKNENLITEGETEDIKSFNYSGSVSVGVGYSIVRNVNINFEPFFKYYLSPINTNPETDVYPYSMGILTGITYSF